MDSIIATDIEPGVFDDITPVLCWFRLHMHCAGFWELGHKLFCSTAETFPAAFLPGDIFDPAHLSPQAISVDAGVTDRTRTPSHFPSSVPSLLKSLSSLNPLRCHVTAIHAGAVFHLFSEERQLTLARALASLLLPAPGSMIVGQQAGAPHKGVRVITRAPEHTPRTSASPPLTISLFCYSPESWAELWDGQVFEKGSVKVEATLARLDVAMEEFPHYYTLYWSVTRL